MSSVDMVQNYHYHQGPFAGQTVDLSDKNIKWSDRYTYYSEHAPFLLTAPPTTETTTEPSGGVVTTATTNTIVTTTKELPKIGEGNSNTLVLVGLAIVFIGCCIMYYKKERFHK
jgi:hypothetical protein